MKTATYTTLGGPFQVEYDELAPCICCGLPVGEASMGGPALCPACDCGYFRDGSKWGVEDAFDSSECATPEALAAFRNRAKWALERALECLSDARTNPAQRASKLVKEHANPYIELYEQRLASYRERREELIQGARFLSWWLSQQRGFLESNAAFAARRPDIADFCNWVASLSVNSRPKNE